MTTVAQRLAELTNPKPEKKTRQQWAIEILSMLPPDMPVPTISNETEANKPNVWLSFSRDYGDTRPGSAFLTELEAAGFKTLPATLAKYGNYRRGVKPGLQTDLPETSSRAELVDSEPIAPVWIVPCQYTGQDAITFYEKDGLTFRIKVPAPASVGVHATRKEIRGDWYFERGSARLRFPEAWHAVQGRDYEAAAKAEGWAGPFKDRFNATFYHNDDTRVSAQGVTWACATWQALCEAFDIEAPEYPIAQIAAPSGAWVDTEKGLSGAIYFTPCLDHADFPLTGAQFLAALEAQQ